MNEAEAHVVKARVDLEFARYALAGEYIEEAGRSAFMAAYHAAVAFIVARTSKSPKTHNGVPAANLPASHARNPASAERRYPFSAGATN
jgi:uncharacterized protein (UPF0332 family)